MTCIVGIEANGKVIMAGDVQGTGYNNLVVHTQPKVFAKRGVLFGYTTSYRYGQILEHDLPDPVIPNDSAEVYRWLITVLVPDIKKALTTHGYDGGGDCLLGVREQLWHLQNDFSVLRPARGYDSCGSGNEYALGSLMASIELMQAKTDSAYRDALSRAVHAAGTFSPTVGTESIIVSN